mmetsp:Transcript_51916/g.116551  ORF Transcript_51916/g.116551 Transcript_51916/m.116551 type:complete len:248 (-) Transcript_51916:527-1270(-)
MISPRISRPRGTRASRSQGCRRHHLSPAVLTRVGRNSRPARFPSPINTTCRTRRRNPMRRIRRIGRRRIIRSSCTSSVLSSSSSVSSSRTQSRPHSVQDYRRSRSRGHRQLKFNTGGIASLLGREQMYHRLSLLFGCPMCRARRVAWRRPPRNMRIARTTMGCITQTFRPARFAWCITSPMAIRAYLSSSEGPRPVATDLTTTPSPTRRWDPSSLRAADTIHVTSRTWLSRTRRSVGELEVQIGIRA